MYSAIVFLPLVAALVAGLGGRVIGDRGAQVVTCGAMSLSSILGVVAFWEVAIGGQPRTIEEIGRESGWARVCQSVWSTGVAFELKNRDGKTTTARHRIRNESIHRID